MLQPYLTGQRAKAARRDILTTLTSTALRRQQVCRITASNHSTSCALLHTYAVQLRHTGRVYGPHALQCQAHAKQKLA